MKKSFKFQSLIQLSLLRNRYDEKKCACADDPSSEEGLFEISKGGNCKTQCNHQLCGVYGSWAVYHNSHYDAIFKTCSQANIMSTSLNQFHNLNLKVENASSVNVSSFRKVCIQL